MTKELLQQALDLKVACLMCMHGNALQIMRGMYPAYSKHWTKKLEAAIRTELAAIAQPEQTLQWTDNAGVKYTFPLAGATQLLADLYAKWPGGLKEIESAMRVNIAQPEQRTVEPTRDTKEAWAAGFKAGNDWTNKVSAYYKRGDFGNQPKEPQNPYEVAAKPEQPAAKVTSFEGSTYTKLLVRLADGVHYLYTRPAKVEPTAQPKSQSLGCARCQRPYRLSNGSGRCACGSAVFIYQWIESKE